MAALLVQSSPSDAELVAASRGGDREAFGSIVRRYQSMVTGMLFASCGDLQRSEDLAQETFVAAWKSLSGLRDPSKLAAWLCQVARHRLLDSARHESRQGARLAAAFQHRSPAEPLSPQQQLLSQEERELLWRTLREIPQPYRETLVMYYRQGQSAAEVARAMDTTEANVRQRLNRGREMLREQVISMLERNLVRSAPGAAFSVAVIAALPVLIPQTTGAAVTAVAVKGATATKTAGLLALLAMWIGPIIGFAGGLLGTWSSIRTTQSPRERRFAIRGAIGLWVLVLAMLAILFAISAAQERHHWSGLTIVLLQSILWGLYGIALCGFIIVYNRRHKRLRREEQLPERVAPPISASAQRRIGATMLAGTAVGVLAWMVVLASRTGDRAGATVIVIAGTALVLAELLYLRHRPLAKARGLMIMHVLVLGAITLVMINWRLHDWIAADNGIALKAARQRAPLWAVNIFAGVLWTIISLITWVGMRRRNGDTAPQNQ